MSHFARADALRYVKFIRLKAFRIEFETFAKELWLYSTDQSLESSRVFRISRSCRRLILQFRDSPLLFLSDHKWPT